MKRETVGVTGVWKKQDLSGTIKKKNIYANGVERNGKMIDVLGWCEECRKFGTRYSLEKAEDWTCDKCHKGMPTIWKDGKIIWPFTKTDDEMQSL